jgi:hypothetical protein
MGSKGSVSKNSSHLSDEQLAQFQDGELSGSQVTHLESCSQCGSRLQNLHAAAMVYLEYQDSIRRPLLPPAPKPWLSLNALIAQHEESHPPRALRWWPAMALAAAACLVVTVVVLYRVLPSRSMEQSSIRANELLTQSARVELPKGRQISMRVHGRTLIRPAVLTTDALLEREPGTSDVQMVFAAAHYSWREPLSARSFQAWRNGLKNKRDAVSVIHARDDKESYRVRTDSPAGALRSASLTLRAQDLRPTDGTFEFEGLGIVEFAEAGLSAEGTSPRRPSAANEPSTETPAGPEDTLHVLAALDKIGADVGEPIDITQDAQRHRVVVHANGLSADRQQQIDAAL